MTDAGQTALERMADGNGRLSKLHASTARSLHDAGLIEKSGSVWEITREGRKHLEHQAAYSYYETVLKECPRYGEKERLIARILALLDALDTIEGRGFGYHNHAVEHMARAIVAGMDPRRCVVDDERAKTHWVKTIETALEILGDYDKTEKEAQAAGKAVVIGFDVGKIGPAERAEKLRELREQTEDPVDMEEWRRAKVGARDGLGGKGA